MTLLSDDTVAQPSVITLMTRVRHRWLLVLLCAIGMATLLVVPQLIRPPRYTAHASFVPQARRQSSLVSGFAAQLGVTLPGQDATQSPLFYSDLARSDGILASIIRTGVHDRSAKPVSFASYYKVSESDTAVARERLIDRLRADVSSSVTAKTNLVELAMTAKDPVIAKETLDNLLAALEQYNSMQRRSQATAERRFAERRLLEVRAELTTAESSLMQFLTSNRDYRNSPTLTFHQERLARDVNLKQQVFTSLSQAVEQARLEEVRDTPVLSVVAPPTRPARANSRKIVTRAMLGMMVGVGLAVLGIALLLLARDTAGRMRTSSAG